MKKKYLICGAGGFIGVYLTYSLMKQGHEVFALILNH
jgi:nucleoside-diphosphate-sugar epimerase